MTHDYFCIDVGESFIKVVDSDIKDGLFEKASLGIIPTEKLFFSSNLEKTNEKQASEIATLLKKLNISKTKVNLILPDSLSYNQIVEMPRLNEKELLSAIKYQADQFIPMPIEEVSLDIEILFEKPVGKKILTFISAAPKKTIEKVQKTIEYTGITIESIETESSACGRLLSEIFKKVPPLSEAYASGILFINMGFSTTTLYFFNTTLKILTQLHNFNIGYHLFFKEIQVNLNIEERQVIELLKSFGNPDTNNANIESILSAGIKDFLSQIQRFISLISEQEKATVTNIYLFNEILRFGNFAQVIQNTLQIPTSLFDLKPYMKPGIISSEAAPNLGFFLPAFGGNCR